MESRNRLSLRHVFVILIGVVRLLPAARYEIEAALRAGAYWWFGTLNSPEEAIIYSVNSIGARRASGFTLECYWRRWLTGGDGRYVLFGIRTANAFMVMQAY